jgi:hypothetical protein
MRQGRFDGWGQLSDGLVMGVCVLLAACATTPSSSFPPANPPPEGEPASRAAAIDQMRHYELALGETSMGAVPRGHSAPIYPAALLATRLPPQEVDAVLVVDAAGKVSEALMAGEAQADPQRRQFMAAVRAAAMQWTFEPFRVSQWAADANGNSHPVDSETRPFRVGYVFHFAWKDGKPVTDAIPH